MATDDKQTAAWSPIAALLITAAVYTLLTLRDNQRQTGRDTWQQTVLVDSRFIKKPYLYGPDQLRKLANIEHRIYLKFPEALKCGLMQSWVLDYESTSLSAHKPPGIPGFDRNGSPEAVVAGHPTLVYRMIRRFNNQFKNMMQHLGNCSTEGKEVLQFINSMQVELRYDWPDNDDLDDAMFAILKIQEVYDGIKVEDVVQGTFLHVQTGIQLDSVHVLEIADYATKSRQFVLSNLWLQFAIQKTPAGQLQQIQERLEELVVAHDQNWEQYSKGAGRFGYFVQQLKNIDSLAAARTVKAEEMAAISGNRTPASETVDYITLCAQGANFQPKKERKNLKCWLDTWTTPELGLLPAKIEQLSRDPPILKFHNAVGGKVAAKIEQLALALQYVEVYVPQFPYTDDHTKPRYFKSRTAACSFISDSQDPDIRLLSRRIESMTNLNVVDSAASDALDIVSYAPGGRFVVHHDCLGETKTKQRGERVATILFYLNQVTLGGWTVFPRIGLGVPPEPGTAILWYNLDRNGDPDWRTYHAGCPVVLGHKTGANKCITEYGNYQKRKCLPFGNGK